MKFFGHVTRIEQRHNTHKWHYMDRHRGNGQPMKRWIDIVKEDCTERRLDIIEAQSAVAIREAQRYYRNSQSIQWQQYDKKKK